MEPKEGKYYIASGYHFMPTIKHLDLKQPFDTFEEAYKNPRFHWDDCWSIIATYRGKKWYIVEYNEAWDIVELRLVEEKNY